MAQHTRLLEMMVLFIDTRYDAVDWIAKLRLDQMLGSI